MLNFGTRDNIWPKRDDIRAKETTFHNRPNCEKPWVGGKVLSTELGRKYKVEVDWKLIKIKRAFTGLVEKSTSEHRIQLYAILAGCFL